MRATVPGTFLDAQQAVAVIFLVRVKAVAVVTYLQNQFFIQQVTLMTNSVKPNEIVQKKNR